MSEGNAFSIKTFLASILGYSFTSWLQAIVSLVSIPIVTRILSPDQYGKINMLVLFITICVSFLRLSTEQSYIRYFLEFEDKVRKKILNQCVWIVVVMFCVLMCILLFYNEAISVFLIGETNFKVMTFYIPIIILFMSFSEYQRVYFKMQNILILYLICAILNVVASKMSLFMTVFTTPDYSHAMAFMAIGYTMSFLLIWLICPPCFAIKPLEVDISMYCLVLRYSLPFLPTTLLLYFNSAVSSYVLKNSFDYATLAVYSATISITNIMAIFHSGFTIYWGPFVYQNYKTNQEIIKIIHSWVSFIMCLTVLMVMMSDNILFNVLGKDYRSGITIFSLLLIPHILTVIAETTCYGIYLNQKTYLQVYATVISIVANVLGSYLLIPIWGLLGATTANILGAFLSFFARTYFGQKEYKSVDNIYRTIYALILVFIAGTCNYIFNSNLLIKNSIILLLIGLLFVVYRQNIRKFVMFIKIKVK